MTIRKLPIFFRPYSLSVFLLGLAILVLIGPVQSYVLAKQQLTVLDSDRQTVIATGPGGVSGILLFGDVVTSTSTTRLIYLRNTGSQDYWIVQTPLISSLNVPSLPSGFALQWNLTSSLRLAKGSNPLPVLLTLTVGPTTGTFDLTVSITAHQTPRG